MNLEDLDKKIKSDSELRTKLLRNTRNTYKGKEKVKKLKKLYGDNFFNYEGSTISEKKLRYWINKIILLPNNTADIRELKLGREDVISVCSEYNNIRLDGFKIVNIGQSAGLL